MHGRLAVTRVSISIESDISVDNLYFCIYEEIIIYMWFVVPFIVG